MSMPERPDWIQIRLKYKDMATAPAAPDSVGTFFEELLRSPLLKYCSYSGTIPRGKINIIACPSTDDRNATLEAVSKLASIALPEGTFSECAVEPYSGLGIKALGGRDLLPLINVTNHFGSIACIRWHHDFGEQNRPSTVLFAMASSVAILDAYGLSRYEKREVFEASVQMVQELLGVGPGNSAWEEIRRVTENSHKDIEPCFENGRLEWDCLGEHLGPAPIEIIREMYQGIRSAFPDFDLTRSRSWQLPYPKAFAKKLIHQFWLRLELDNLKESVCMAWLAKRFAEAPKA